MLDEDRFVISDSVIIEIFQSLYYPNNSYEFGVVDPYIIGQIYELFLDESLEIQVDGQVVCVQKPEVVDAQGTVNTPKNITDIIVDEALGALYEGKTPEEVAGYRIADICCGSGNFLLSAFEYVVNYHIEYLCQGKFDAIIGNPPYIRVQNMVHYSPEEYAFYKSNQSGYVTAGTETLDKYYLFIERALLSKGVWYQYNEDYLSYLRDSIAEIAVEYHPEFDFTSVLHDQFVDSKYEQEKDDHKYAGKSPAEIKNSLKKKYYAERAFNLLREESNGFVNYDRDEVRVGGSRVEVMDLYKEGMMCAVKIGNASSKLCYAVDQSLTALKLYKKHQLPRMPEVSTIVLWFVLERQDHIEDENGCPQLEELDMLMLKNRLDQWKKEVRLQGLKPLIYINYRTN